MTRIEIVARQQEQLRKLTEQRMASLSDSPQHVEDADSLENGPRMLASALLLMALVILLVGLACRAWVIEDDQTAARVRATVQQMEGR